MRPTPYFKALLFFTAFTAMAFAAAAQGGGFSEKFQEASRLDIENELGQALLKWTELAIANPENANVNYRAGRAYLNSFNKKTQAEKYLVKAAKGEVSKNYDPISPFEKKVPIEVYYYYAKSLHLNSKFNDAQAYYEKFLLSASSKHYLYAQADLGAKQVDNARILMKVPMQFEIENLGEVINTEYPEYSPVISVDENSLFYTSVRPRRDSSNLNVLNKATGLYFEDIYASYKDSKGNWQTPELLSINTPNNTASMNVSVDGQTLFLYKDETGNGDIYESRLVGETWLEPQLMSSVINTPAWETHLAITPDAQTAFFVSARKGGLGGRDIYTCQKLPNGQWGAAQNVGAVINTPYEEDAVFISPDSRTLYFSSQGHSSMGGFDIFYSELDENGAWKEPVNIGYPINTVDDDVFFVTSADGRRAYYSSERDSGYGEKDIYMISLPDPRGVSLAVLKGLIIPAEGDKLPEDIVIVLTNKRTGEEQYFTPRARDGVFLAILPPCNDYDVNYKINGKSAARDAFSIACDINYQEINKELLLSPLLVNSDGTAVIVSSTSGDAVPADFKIYFGYNENMLTLEEASYAKFMAALKIKLMKQGSAEISIVGSASKVPTKSFKSNAELAQKRADGAKKRILENAHQFNIDVEKINFVSVEGKVQGPEYQGDFNTGEDKYEKFQYIDVTAR